MSEPNLCVMKFLSILLFVLVSTLAGAQTSRLTLLKNVNVVDGTGQPTQKNVNVLIEDGVVKQISSNISERSAQVVDLTGKTIMPVITNVHAHLGMATNNHSRIQIAREAERYLTYGVGTVLSMGTDKETIFTLRDESRAGKLPGATIYTAGYGFRPPLGNRPQEVGMEKLYRPATPEEARQNVRELAALKPDVVKIWVDNMGYGKITPEVYGAIIDEAHKHGIRVAAHLFYLEDAHKLLDAGVDIFAHSVRDKEVDDRLIKRMKAMGTIYIPTLTRDAYEFYYGTDKPWLGDPFFAASLDEGVLDMIKSAEYRNRITSGERYAANQAAFNMALKNLKKLHDAGVLVALGTDSGATPVRAQGFSEHLELKLMVDAGLTPAEAIATATRNACQAMKLAQQGTLAPGMKADFIVLDADPLTNIQNTWKIDAVWKNGKEVSKGPLRK